MALHPFRPPQLSPVHRRLLEELVRHGSSHAHKAYGKFSKIESRRYKDASGDHCVYCGARNDRLDIDHFHPKSRPKYESVNVQPAMDIGQCNARIVSIPIALSNDERLVYEKTNTRPQCSDTRAIDPGNLAPSCSACNSPTRVRLFNDHPTTVGKHNRFPVMQNPSGAGVIPSLPSPFLASWSQLRARFAFVDLNDPCTARGRGRSGEVLGSVRATIVLPRLIYDAIREGKRVSVYEGETLSALTAIDMLGLNRKRLAEDRFRHRRMFRTLLPSIEALGKLAQEQSLPEMESRLEALDRLKSVEIDPVKISKALHEWPHKLALLDMLLRWAGEPAEFDVDSLMPSYSDLHSPTT